MCALGLNSNEATPKLLFLHLIFWSTRIHAPTHRTAMDLRQLLNRQDEQAKRVPLGELNNNINRPVKRVKPNPFPVSKLDQPLQLPETTSTPHRLTSAHTLSLPPISHLTNSLSQTKVITNLSPGPAPMAGTTPMTPTRTPAGPTTPATGNNFLYGVQNSRKKSEMFFNITSADDFQRRADVDSDRSVDHSMERSFQGSLPSSTVKRTRRKVLWSHEASIAAAHEFKKLYDIKISSSFLKREYQDIAEILNLQFGKSLFSETSVRNRKGFFQCLSHIYTSLKDHRIYQDRFNEHMVPMLSEQEWKEVGQYFEPSYLRKFRGKEDNEDLEIVCGIFKKRPMRRNDDLTYMQPFRQDELRVIGKIVILVQKGMLTLEEVTAVFVQSEEVAWIGLLYPHLEDSDEEFLHVVRENFNLSKTGGGKGEVDLQRFWKMMSMTQGQ